MRGAKRRAILDAALALVTEGGAGGLTVERLLSAAGAGVGTFYHHFPAGQEDVVRALDAEVAALFRDGLERLLGRNRQAEMGLPAAVHHVVRWVTEHPAAARIYLRGEGADAGLLRGVEAWAAGVGLPDLPADVLWAAWLGPVFAWARLWLAGASATAPDAAAQALARSAAGLVRGGGR